MVQPLNVLSIPFYRENKYNMVNGADNGLDKRKAALETRIKSGLFDCEIPQEEVKQK
jgi:hypothetical protein